MFLDEESVKKRLGLVRGFKSVNQVEFCYMFTREPMQIKEAAYEGYPGCSNKGNAIGPIALPELTSGWVKSLRDKKAIYGKSRRAVGGKDTVQIDAGGAGSGDDAPTSQPPCIDAEGQIKTDTERSDDNYEPVFYRVLPRTWYKSVTKGVKVKGIIDLDAGNGALLLASIERKKPYVGFTFNAVHSDSLKEYALGEVLTMFADQDSDIFQPTFVALQKDDKPGSKKKKKTAPGKEPKKKKPKPTTTRPPKDNANDDEEEEDDDDDDDDDADSDEASGDTA